MNRILLVLLLICGLLSSGCFTYRSYVPLNLSEVKLQVPINAVNITIVDARNEISEEDDIKIPFMTGLKKKSWKHHPKLTPEYKNLIETTIKKNFTSTSIDTGSMTVIINYACKEFEQTGVSEIERVYLSIETSLKTAEYQYASSSLDTFHYESMDASKKHFEKFFQSSLQNNIVKNIAQLRNQFFNSEKIERECFDESHNRVIRLNREVQIVISGKHDFDTLELGKVEFQITQDWNFKISSNERGELTYIELLDNTRAKGEELQMLYEYLNKLRINELNHNQKHHCRKLRIESVRDHIGQ